LSIFSWKAGSAHDAGGGVTPGGSSSTNIDDHWPKGSIAEGVRIKGHASAKARGDLEAVLAFPVRSWK
jgi:hypothetical protein